MYKDCIILAGGMGTRLRDVVSDRPKCLADISGKPFLYYQLEYLIPFQPHQVILAVGYQKEQVKDFIREHQNQFPFQIRFSEEEQALGTGGAIALAMSQSETEDVFILNGDTFHAVDLHRLLSFQQQKMADCSLALKWMDTADRYGLVSINSDEQILSFKEKTPQSSGLINAGIYCLFKNSFLNIPFPETFSFEKDFLEKFLPERQFFGFENSSYFIDIGIPEDYQKAQIEIPQLLQV